MLRGDLTVETSEALLSTLAQQEATGCLVIEEPAQQGTGDAQIHFRAGKIYAAALPGGTFLVGTRLTTSFGLGSDALGEALEAQRAELHGWRLGEILVHLGHVDAQAVDAISREQVLEIITETCSWKSGGWRFRAGDRTRAMLGQPIDVPGMLVSIAQRQLEWHRLQDILGSPETPIVAAEASRRPTEPLELVALLRMVDTRGAAGLRSCSHATGLSLLEGARLAVTAFAGGALRRQSSTELVGVTVAAAAAADVRAAGLADSVARSSEPVSHMLTCLLALAGPAVVATASPAPPAALPEPDLTEPDLTGSGADATVLDLTAARAARSGEQPVVEQSVAQLSGTASPPVEDTAAIAARKDAFAPAFILPAQHDVPARDVPARDVRVLSEQVERARQSQLDADDVDALQMATALRAAAEVHAQREASSRRLPAAFSAPAATVTSVVITSDTTASDTTAAVSKTVPAWTRPADPEAVARATWGQGFLSMTPPRTGDSSPVRDPQADTASLMRELTSLGRSDETEDARPAPQPAQFRSARQLSAPAAAAVPEKKRKSFFGR